MGYTVWSVDEVESSVKFTVTINDPSEHTSRLADWIYKICHPSMPVQNPGGVYTVDIEAERAGEVYDRLANLSPGDLRIEVHC